MAWRVRPSLVFAIASILTTLAAGGRFDRAVAGVGVWTTAGPEGGTVLAVAVDPQTPEIVYAGPFSSELFKSTTAGSFWSPLDTGQPGAIGLAVDPQTPTILYAANGYAGVVKSLDGGLNWNRINSGLPFPSVGNVEFARVLAIDPRSPGTVYLGTGTFSGGRIFKTTNGGASWRQVFAAGADFEVLVVDGGTPATVYAGSIGAGLFKSTSGGSAWTAANTGLVDLFIIALAVDPTAVNVLYMATGSGVFKSTNAGVTWTFSNSGLPGGSTISLAVDPVATTTLYAGTYRAGGVFKSVNGGATWTSCNAGFANLAVRTLAVGARVPATIYAGTEGGGMFRSVTGCAAFDQINAVLRGANVHAVAVLPHAQNILFAGTHGGVFRSDNGGAYWSSRNAGITDPIVNAFVIPSATPNVLYAGTSEGDPTPPFGTGAVFTSTDGGSNWKETLRTSRGGIFALVGDPQAPGTLYAGNGMAGVHKTTDGGQTWTLHAAGLPFPSNSEFLSSLAVDPQTPTTLYLGTGNTQRTQGRVFKSTDGAATWREVVQAPASVAALAIDPAAPATVYAASYSGILKSTNGGTSWSPLAAARFTVTALSINVESAAGPAAVYAGSYGAVFKSTDGGATWNLLGRGLRPSLVQSLAVNRTGTCVHAGTGGSVFDFATQVSAECPSPPTVAAAISPPSRSVAVGAVAQTLATITHVGSTGSGPHPLDAQDSQVSAVTCGVTQLTGAPTDFSFQAVDTSDRPTGALNTPVDIAPGAQKLFRISLLAKAPLCPIDIKFGYNCTNSKLASILTGVNTLLLSAGDTSAGACGLGTSASVSESTFGVGQTLIAGGSVTNPGLVGIAADFYVGILRPDHSIQFLTSTGTVIGSLANLTSFRPLAANVPLGTAFSVSRPTVFQLQRAAADLPGEYVFFVAAVRTGALAGGTVTSGQILSVSTASYSFP